MNENESGNGQRELALAEGIRVTPRALILTKNLTHVQWRECGRFLRHSHHALVFWRADWLKFGEKKFGPKRTGEAITQLGAGYALNFGYTLTIGLPFNFPIALFACSSRSKWPNGVARRSIRLAVLALSLFLRGVS
jgi:hypothetical protein